MDKIGNGFGIRSIVQAGQPPKTCVSAERMRQLNDALKTLASLSRDSLLSHVLTLICEVLPGKRIARLDVLESREGHTFTDPHTTCPDGSLTFAGREDISPVLEYEWDRLGVSGDPDFVVAMKTINTGREVEKHMGKEILLGVPLLSRSNTVMGAMVLSNETWEELSPVTPEDRELLGIYAQRVSEFIEKSAKK